MPKFKKGDVILHRVCGQCALLMEDAETGDLIERCKRTKYPLGCCITITAEDGPELYDVVYRRPARRAGKGG